MTPFKPAAAISMIVLALTCYFGYDLYLNYQQGVSRIQADLNRHQQTQEFRMKLAESLQDAKNLQQQLAPEPTSEWLLDHVSALAKEAGVEITSATPYPPRQVNRFIQPSVALQVAASYHQLGQFLSIVESSTPFVRVDELNVSPSVKSGQPPSARVTVSSVYAAALEL